VIIIQNNELNIIIYIMYRIEYISNDADLLLIKKKAPNN